MTDDLHVIQRVLQGNVESFRVLVERYERPLFCMIRNLISNPDDCEEIAQEVFLAAYQNLVSYDPARARFSTWLFTIARNKCVNHWRKRRPVTMEAVADEVERRLPEAALVNDELFRALDDALASLPVNQKTVFVMSQLQGLTLEEIGMIEGVKLGTVKSRLTRARDKLRALMQHAMDPL